LFDVALRALCIKREKSDESPIRVVVFSREGVHEHHPVREVRSIKFRCMSRPWRVRVIWRGRSRGKGSTRRRRGSIGRCLV
jgi:hypothetical protein